MNNRGRQQGNIARTISEQCMVDLRPIFCSSILIISAISFSRYNSSPMPFGYWLLSYSVLFTLSVTFASSKNTQPSNIELSCALILIIWNFFGLGFWLIICVINTIVFPWYELIFFTFYFFLFVMFILFILCVAWQIVRDVWVKKQENLRRADQYKSIFEKIENNPSFNVEAYIQQYKPIFEVLPLQPVDFKTLYSYCVKKFSYLEEQERQENCTICFEVFSGSTMVFTHPGCGHRYDWTCIETWFKGEKKQCPTCRADTREELLREVKNQNLKGE